MRERGAEIGSFLIETLQGMRLVVTSGAEAHEVDRFRQRNRSFVKALLDMQLTSYFAGATPGTILAVSSAILFLYGGKLVIDGAMTVGTLVAILAYHLRLLGPVQSLMSVYTSLVTGAVSLSRVFELLDSPIEVSERPDAEPLAEAQGAITFEGVNFRYAGETPVLDSVSFHVPAGSICAIVGPSGVGKSTIADLMLRLYDPDSGVVRLDGRDLRDLSFADLRRAIALVDQSPHLFHATIRENIAYADPEATTEQITQPPARPPFTISSRPCRTATTRWSASAASPSRPASASGSRSRAPCSAVRRFWCSMSRPPPWTPPPKRAFPRASPG